MSVIGFIHRTLNSQFVDLPLKEPKETLNYTFVIMNIKRSGTKKAKEKSLMERFRRHNDRVSPLIIQSDVFTDNTLARATCGIYNDQCMTRMIVISTSTITMSSSEMGTKVSMKKVPLPASTWDLLPRFLLLCDRLSDIVFIIFSDVQKE